jgi:hypothetical protein
VFEPISSICAPSHVQEVAQLLHVRLGRGITDDRIPFCHDSRHDGVLRRGDACLVHQEIRAAQTVRPEGKTAVIRHVRAEGAQGQDVRIETSAPDHIAAGRGQFELAHPRRHRSRHEDRCADLAAKVRVEVRRPQVPGGDAPRSGIQFLDLRTQAFE